MPETLQGRPPARKLAGFRDIFKHEEFLAEIVCGRFFHQRPEYEERFRQVCREDITHTLRYLACSVDSGRFDLFRSYLLWLRELLEKRNLPVGHLTESLAIMREELEPWLQEPILVTTHAFLEQGVTLLETPWSEVHSREVDIELNEWADRYLELILTGNRRGTNTLISDLGAQGEGYVDLIVDVIQPAMVQIGRLWQSNKISVAQEHLATAITHNILAQCLMQAEPKEPVDSSAIFACVENNQHSLGLLITSDAFELAGWETHYLGADTPRESLLRYIRDTGPDLVGLSISLPQHVLQVRDVVEAIHGERIAKQPFILVGGHCARQLSPLLHNYGVDGVCGDVRECLQYATP